MFSQNIHQLTLNEVSNQDHTFMQGVEAVDALLEGKKEITVWNPNKVNGK